MNCTIEIAKDVDLTVESNLENGYKEFCIFTKRNHNNEILQDIVRVGLNDDGTIYVKVFGDDNDEDYTDEFVIKQIDSDEPERFAISFNNQNYDVVEFDRKEIGAYCQYDWKRVRVAPNSLKNSIYLSPRLFSSEDAKALNSSINYYVPDKILKLKSSEISEYIDSHDCSTYTYNTLSADTPLDFIEFKSKEYPIRIINYTFEDDSKETLVVATETLQDELIPNNQYFSNVAKSIDEDIFCYIPDDMIHLKDEEICKYIKENIE